MAGLSWKYESLTQQRHLDLAGGGCAMRIAVPFPHSILRDLGSRAGGDGAHGFAVHLCSTT